MWFLDTNHPSIFVRLIARFVWTILSVIAFVLIALLVVWAYDKFGGHDTYGQIKSSIDDLRAIGWKKVALSVLGFAIVVPVVLDLLAGDNRGYRNNDRGGYNNNRNNGGYNNNRGDRGGYDNNDRRDY